MRWKPPVQTVCRRAWSVRASGLRQPEPPPSKAGAEGLLERKGTKKTKVLLPTDKGKALITVMPEEIQSPEMTADWETKLLQIERSEMEPETFMTEIKEMISSLVTTTEAAKGANALMKNKIIGVCPNCGKPVVEREKGWFCENRECRFVLWKDNAFFKRLGKRLDSHVADKLLRDSRVRLKDCKSAKGKTYNATVLLGTEVDGRSKFSLELRVVADGAEKRSSLPYQR